MARARIAKTQARKPALMDSVFEREANAPSGLMKRCEDKILSLLTPMQD